MKMTINKDNLKGPRSIAWFLLFTFCSQLIVPSVSYAGGGGPTQPEVQGFTPIGVSDMVDPFTGDFTYNIPLMDIEGYPINISYTGGISMDQEASWVGLGWNLNTGSVVRNMRGLPDDFNGDVVEKTQTQKANTTIGLDLGAGVELFGFDPSTISDGIMGNGGASINVGLGFSYNNYTGYATQFSFGPSFNFGKAGSPSGTAGFQLSGSSENGASFAPSLSFDKKITDKENNNLKLTSTIGASMNSRAGLGQISYSGRLSETYKGTSKHAAKDVKNDYSDNASMSVGGAYDLGLHSYSPTVGPSMQSVSVTGNWKVAGTFFAADASYDIRVSYSRQWIPDYNRTFSNPAYGYLNLERGQLKDNALMDFNRDNEGSFTKYTPNLPSAHLTYDIFSVNAQGTGGTFRAFRNEVGYVFDPVTSTHSTSGGVGIETGGGNAFDLGVDLSFNMMESTSGPWRGGTNEPGGIVKFENASPLLEKFAFQEANEHAVDNDRLFVDQFSGATPTFFPLDGSNLSPVLKANVTTSLVNNGAALADNNRDYRIKRNQLMTFLTIQEVRDGMAINTFPKDEFGVEDVYLSQQAPNHHIGEITQLGTDGRRYVFGLPAYNHFQEDVTFSIGQRLDGSAGIAPADYYNGLVNYSVGGSAVVGPDNQYGIDNYYSSTKTPAYAHSFMLTSVLSDDYVDSDGDKGPSDNDLGSFVKFSYVKEANYEWRTPMGEKQAFYNEGLKVDKKDDKASFIRGEKDLWYVKTIETKNYVAVFVLEDRLDAGKAAGRDGGIDNSSSMQCIKKISLYSKPEYNAHIANLALATPLQEVHFVYDYLLCQGYPGNTSPITATNQGGKLTLKEIYFTYQNSNKMKRSSYTFEYPNNPGYNMKAVDRWGFYMPTSVSSGAHNVTMDVMNNADFPYTIQNNTQTDVNAAAWSMKYINLPSGGRITVDYESDDYAFVQHLPANQMFPIAGTEGNTPVAAGSYGIQSVSNSGDKNKDVLFRLNSASDNINDYVKIGDMIYFRCLVEIRMSETNDSPTKYEYVSGYARVNSVAQNGIIGQVGLEAEQLKDGASTDYSPITKAAIQFGRLHLPNDIYSQPSSDGADGSEQGLLDFAQSVVGALGSLGELVTGPNMKVYNEGRGQNIVVNKSWIRLKEPRHKKLGGGIRVKRILMSDNWDYMLKDTDPATDYKYEYGQEFVYQNEDGTSSGVASYEPMIGGDENPWHQPVLYENKKRFAMDDKLYIEDPVMESQFPSPSVGYSRVVIRDLQRTGVTRTATGKTVKEFYTAKDYPTIVHKSSVDMMTANSFLPVLPKYQLLTASQGFSIELNDMHGKPKKESIYAQNKTLPISTVEYFYQHSPIILGAIPANRLTNKVQVIKSDGTTAIEEIGVKYDGTADFRESKMGSYGGSIDLNVDGFFAAVFPAVVPTIWPQVDISFNQFRSATMSRVINRFGVLEKTVANQDGSIVETNNLAYDAETGEILATQTTTDFNDKVYSMNYPAYWKYDRVGMAYKNAGYTYSSATFNSNGFVAIPPSLNQFVEGDEVVVKSSFGAVQKGWVAAVTSSGISLIDKTGAPILVSAAQTSDIKVVRSGRKNKQSTSMATLTSLSNPLNAILSNAYTQVLNAGAVEFSDDWNTYCKCFTGETETTNPYVLGIKGNWRPVKSYTHLSGRTQSDYDNNTNIRRDGVFSSYTPYYRLTGGSWGIAGQNWTYVSEVTQYSPNGMTLETRDPLGRYSATQFSFNNTLTTAIAANTRMKQLAFGSFEDKDYTNCMDQNFFTTTVGGVSSAQAHTGRNSILVTNAKPRTFGNLTNECESNAPCALSLSPSAIPTVINIQNGTAPYQLEAEVISGTGDAVLNANGTIAITFNSSSYFEIRLCVTDSKGCKTCFNTTGLASF